MLPNREANVQTDIGSAAERLSSLVTQLQGIVDSANILAAQRSLCPYMFDSAGESSSAWQNGQPVLGALPTSASSISSGARDTTKPHVDVHGYDICEALSQLAVSHVQKQKPRKGMAKDYPLVEEVGGDHGGPSSS